MGAVVRENSIFSHAVTEEQMYKIQIDKQCHLLLNNYINHGMTLQSLPPKGKAAHCRASELSLTSL